MLARLFVRFQPGIFIPRDTQFPIRAYPKDGYLVRELVPCRITDQGVSQTGTQITVNAAQTDLCDWLRIEFVKEAFERRVEKPFDPPLALITYALTSHVTRLRYVLRGGALRVPPFPDTEWLLKYLNDDGSELPEIAGFHRDRLTRMVTTNWIAMSLDHWKEVGNLEPDFAPEPWHDLLLDATHELPRLGPAIVLAATGLEVLISTTLDKLASASQLPPTLWGWMTERSDPACNPSVEDQFDVLLKHFTGHSLKDEPKHWEVFKNLKTARNSFVHEGVLRVGGKPLTPVQATLLVKNAGVIPTKIREWLPDELKWPLHDIRMKLTISQEFV